MDHSPCGLAMAGLFGSLHPNAAARPRTPHLCVRVYNSRLFCISRHGADFPSIGSFILVVTVSLVGVLPFLADRLIAPRLKGFVSTLVLPLAFVTLEYVKLLTSSYGSWGSLAYTQYGNLPLLQILSVTGLWGITFLIAWFASVVN